MCEPTDGGAAIVVASLAASQVERGWRVGVAAPPGGFLLDRVRAAGAECLTWPATGSPGLAVGGELRRLRRVVHAFDPDVVHLHSSKAGLAGRLLLRGRIPTMFQPHGWSFRVAEGTQRVLALRWERCAARWALIVAVSDAEGRRAFDAGISGELLVVHNGVDTSRFVPVGHTERRRVRTELGLREVPTVVSVGRHSAEKGHTILLDAWTTIRATVPNATLVLVGDGPLRADLEARGVEGVRFVGEVDDVRGWYAAADVVVLPSFSEAMPLTVLEALASGRCVVATDVDGAREAIGNEPGSSGGAIVPIGDAGALAREVVARLEDPRAAEAEGRIGRARMEQSFSLTTWHETMAAVTQSLVADQP